MKPGGRRLRDRPWYSLPYNLVLVSRIGDAVLVNVLGEDLEDEVSLDGNCEMYCHGDEGCEAGHQSATSGHHAQEMGHSAHWKPDLIRIHYEI